MSSPAGTVDGGGATARGERIITIKSQGMGVMSLISANDEGGRGGDY